MNPKELRQRLEQVAELKDRKPAKSPTHNRLAKEIVIEVDEDGTEYEVEVEITENNTLGYDLVKIKDQHRLCELGCGEIIANQVIEKRFARTPVAHWRTRCQNCDCYVSPDGLGFIRGGHQIQAAYNRHFNQLGRKSVEADPVPETNPRIIEHADHTEIVTNNSVIRRYK